MKWIGKISGIKFLLYQQMEDMSITPPKLARKILEILKNWDNKKVDCRQELDRIIDEMECMGDEIEEWELEDFLEDLYNWADSNAVWVD